LGFYKLRRRIFFPSSVNAGIPELFARAFDSIGRQCYVGCMTLCEAVLQMQARPEYLAVLGVERVVWISPSGYLMTNGKKSQTYLRPRVSDLVALTWNVYTPQQLQELVAGAQQG